MSSGREIRGIVIIGVVAVLGVCIALLALVRTHDDDVPDATVSPAVSDSPLTKTAKPIPKPIAPEVAADAPSDEHDGEPPPISEAQARAAIDAARARGDRTGIAAFNPPGTKPLKRGIIVPDGVQLPQGYMRHYQATDDGQGVAPILVFHPDFVPKDASGNPIAIPKNRVVPPELAPPGIPIRYLELPDDETK